MTSRMKFGVQRVAFADFMMDGVRIPRWRRMMSCRAESKRETEASKMMSVFAAASILMEMAYSNVNVNVNVCCDGVGMEKKNEKRKRAPTYKAADTTLSTKKPRKKRKEIKLSSEPDMPAAMRDRISEMGGHQIQLVIQKQLQDTDLNKNHGRLSLPSQKLVTGFTTEEEEKLLNQQEKKSKKGIDVLIVDPLLRESSICLKKWKIGSQNVYCLMTKWNSFVEETSLKSGDYIQLWSFRKVGVNSNLCFALVKLDITDCI